MSELVRPKHAGLRHVALNVVDIAAAERFYVDVLGFEVEWKPDPDNIYLCSGNDNLALHTAQTVELQHSPLGHIGLIVDEKDEVDSWYAYLLEHSVKMITEPKTHRDGARSFYCYDPARTVVQIIYHPPISKGK